jgi:hypothetical protein
MIKMRKSAEELFNLLDVNRDGELSRTDLHQAAQRLGWHWYHAPLYAVLDLLTIRAPLSGSTFISYMNQIFRDADGPYGRVLLHSALFTDAASRFESPISSDPALERETHGICSGGGDIPALLECHVGNEIAGKYRKVLQDLDEPPVQIPFANAGLLIIDPQCSFTSGVWMQSLGANADLEVGPIRLAFDNCARLLYKLRGRVETMFTRCPFPPGNYQWDERLHPVIKDSQLYFIKPGNSVMWPPTNGFREWVRGLLTHGKKILVMGGCTLNSCVRVSSSDVMEFFRGYGLGVVVDLSISGARIGNFIPSSQYGGLSSVDSAIRHMKEAGVQVVRYVNWRSS